MSPVPLWASRRIQPGRGAADAAASCCHCCCCFSAAAASLQLLPAAGAAVHARRSFLLSVVPPRCSFSYAEDSQCEDWMRVNRTLDGADVSKKHGTNSKPLVKLMQWCGSSCSGDACGSGYFRQRVWDWLFTSRADGGTCSVACLCASEGNEIVALMVADMAHRDR